MGEVTQSNKSEGTCEVPQNLWAQEIQCLYDGDLGVVREGSSESSVVVHAISNDSMRVEEVL